jgi:hypothetical protein
MYCTSRDLENFSDIYFYGKSYAKSARMVWFSFQRDLKVIHLEHK